MEQLINLTAANQSKKIYEFGFRSQSINANHLIRFDTVLGRVTVLTAVCDWSTGYGGVGQRARSAPGASRPPGEPRQPGRGQGATPEVAPHAAISSLVEHCHWVRSAIPCVAPLAAQGINTARVRSANPCVAGTGRARH